MDIANYISVRKNILKSNVRMEIRGLLKKIWEGYDISNLDVDEFAVALSKDKKNVGEELRLILCRGYGKVFKTPQILNQNFKNWLVQYLNNELKY